MILAGCEPTRPPYFNNYSHQYRLGKKPVPYRMPGSCLPRYRTVHYDLRLQCEHKACPSIAVLRKSATATGNSNSHVIASNAQHIRHCVVRALTCIPLNLGTSTSGAKPRLILLTWPGIRVEANRADCSLLEAKTEAKSGTWLFQLYCTAHVLSLLP